MPVLTEKQRNLYLDLQNAIERGDITDLLKQVEKNDFIEVFTSHSEEKGEKLLGTFESLKVKQVQAVLNRAKELGISFEEIIDLPIFYSKSEEAEHISLLGCIGVYDFKFLPDVLHAIDGSDGLELLWKMLSVDDRKMIKNKLNEGEYKDMLGKINEIEKNMAEEDQSEIKSKSVSPTSKAIVAGAICGVISALVVGSGCFAAGVALPMLSLIGIAVAAALVTGLIAGGITYKMSKPSEKLDSVDAEQKASTAASMVV